MNVTTVPASRFSWEGQTVEYVVNAEGATELFAPEQCEEGLVVRVLESKPMGDGIQARVAVEVAHPVFY